MSAQLRSVQAVIFDLDGTLINSEPNYREVDSRFLLSKGILLSDEEWDDVVGMGGGPFIELLRRRHGIEGSSDELIAEKDELYLQYAAGRTEPFARVHELVRYLYVRGMPMGVGTSSRSRVLERMLDEAGLRRYFGARVGSDDVALSKPEPDIFLEVARRLDVDPARCLVVEDSQYGVRAARRAGMHVVALPAPGMHEKEAFSRADVVFEGGPDKLDPELVLQRFELAQAGPPLDPEVIRRFQSVVREFHSRSCRRMPWRETDNPYHILVSEFMLQQTQVSRVEPRYRAFLERFPTVNDLAIASLREVLELWQGLGYNRRGKNLRDAAAIIAEEYAGRVPSEVDELRRLPGVGAYTAAAVSAFAYGRAVVMIETNIRRLFIHFFFQGLNAVHDRDLEPLIRATLPEADVRHWYYALMDYGSHLGRVFPNANRRSRHYTRQSRFAGSVREVRGRIVQALSSHGSLTVEELERLAGPTDERFEPAIEGLARDGMVSRSGDTVTLR